ncbi:MAG TPA: PQQ-binding-like beta-propeller repeat protein [Ktedonobacteraceae bacterium]|nr:PQQ-binding-like beta-propeller repeat protein [Ktedonobacteraceae bacterium]
MKRLSLVRYWLQSFPAQLAVGFGILFVLANLGAVGFVLKQNGEHPLLTAHPGQSRGVVLATSLNAHQVLVATLTNDVLLEKDGNILQHAHFSDPVGGVAAGTSDQGLAYYVGTTDGTISVLNSTFQRIRTLHVNGRIVGVRGAPDGGIFVAYGVGAYSNDYSVAHFSPTTPVPTFTTKISFTISALYATGTMIAYGTQNSQVGMIDARSGKALWSATLVQPVSRILLLSDNRVLVGDTGGNVILLNGQGQTTWELSASQYAIRSLAFDEKDGRFLVGDANGQFFALDLSGNILATQTVAGDDVQELLPQELLPDAQVYTLVPRDGQWHTLHPSALPGIMLENELQPFWIGFDVVCLAGLLLSIILATRRLRLATGRILSNMKRTRLAYFFTLPAIAVILLFSYFPALMALYYSFTNFSLQNVMQYVGIQNYIDILLHDNYFRTGLWNMVLLIVASILKTITFPLLAAELVFWVRNSVHRYIFRTLFVLPAVVPALVQTFMWRMVYDPNSGLLNQIFSSLGLPQWQHAWLGEEGTALGAIIGVGFPFISAFAFLIYMGGLLNINPELYDAAQVDGANWFIRFRSIDLHFLLPQFRVLLFFVLAGTVQGFVDIFVLTKGGPGTVTYVPALQMYFNLSDGHFGYASAIGIILFIIIVVPTVFVLRFRRQTLEEVA